MSTRKPRTTPPKPAPASRPPIAGPGRPRKPRAPRTAQQAALADAIELAEAKLDEAVVAYGAEDTVAAEIKMLRIELTVASLWASYCRAQGIHVHALRYADDRTRLAGRLSGLREIRAADQLAALTAKRGREDALAKRKGARS